jgi:hypothetical protein
MEDPMKDVQMGDVCPDLPCSLIFSGVDNKFWRGGDAIHKQQVYSESYIASAQLRIRIFTHPDNRTRI